MGIPNNKSTEIYNAFSKYIDTGDRSLIEKFTLEDLKFTLLQYNLDKGWPAYVAIEQRISELEKEDTKRNKEETKMPISEEHIKKLTIPELIKMLTLGAWIFVIGSYVAVSAISYRLGYSKGLSQSLSNRQEVPFGQLTEEQKVLVLEIWKYQKSQNLNKVIIKRDGLIFDDIKNEDTKINLSNRILGVTSTPNRFEKLITSIPSTFLKMIPETRLGSPYVVSIPDEAREVLDRKL